MLTLRTACLAVDLNEKARAASQTANSSLNRFLFKADFKLNILDDTNAIVVLAVGGYFVVKDQMSYGGLLAFVTVSKVRPSRPPLDPL